jgi:thioredoxin reductase
MPRHIRDYEVVIVGGGPAGLSAALILGRCRRRVLLVDADRPRNATSHALHGFLTRDGTPPQDLRRVGLEQLAPYDSVKVQRVAATRARAVTGGFDVALSDGTRARCRKLLLATGVVDHVPEVEGLAPLYGRSVFHCPYCDGWECRDQRIAVYGGSNAVGLALELLVWTRDLVVCTDGQRLITKDRERLVRHQIEWRQEPIARVHGSRGRLNAIEFRTGDRMQCRYMFFSTGQRQGCDLAEKLGCAFTRKGAVHTGTYEATNIPGLYVAGDASRLVQLAIVAAAEGAQAAFAINKALIKEELAKTA